MKLYSIVTLIAVLAVTACNTGGNRKSVGRQCQAGDWKPFSMDVGGNQSKLSLNPNANKIPVGEHGSIYKYEGSTLYYVDDSGFRIQIDDIKQKDESFRAVTSCVRNGRDSFKAPLQVEGLRTINVTSDKKYLVEVINISLAVKATVFEAAAVKDPNKKLESPADAYKTAADSFLVSTANNNVNYEVRSTGRVGTGTYYLLVRLTREDQPKPKTP